MRGSRFGRGLTLVALIALATGLGVATGSLSAEASPSTTSQSVRPHSGFGHVTSGYWQVQADGQVFVYGDAVDYTPEPPVALNEPIVSAARTADGGGYWLVASDGGVFSYGDAQFYGSAANTVLNRPIVGMAPTPDGHGYWLVASDGGVFSYGDAQFYGSAADTVLNKPIVGMAPTPDGHGYWLVASDGGVFSFGDAQFYGSAADTVLNKPIVGMAPTPDGHGYWLVASDGGVFSYGGAPFEGSTGGLKLAAPVVGMASSPNGGYYVTASDGGLFAFGGAEFDGSAVEPPPYRYPYATVAVMSQSPSFGSIAAGTPFSGYRFRHGAELTLGDDGRFSISFRTYNNINYPGTHVCSSPNGCDLFVGPLIIDGGHAGGRITSIAGSSASTAVSYDPSGLFSTSTPTMTYDPSTDEVIFSGSAGAFCGTNTGASNDCGA